VNVVMNRFQRRIAEQLSASQEEHNFINFVVHLLSETLTLRKSPARNLICGDNMMTD
jgi:hypothetical protein